MTSRRIKSVLIGGLFSAFVPLAAYLYLRMQGHDGHIKLPKVYGIDRVDTVQRDGQTAYDTTWHTCSNLTLINQLGDTLRLNESFDGKILVVNFFFTHCQTICPVQTKNMKLLNKAFKKNDTSVRFISMTVDPLNDSVPVLRAYADRQEANHDKWIFGTGKKEAIYDFARRDLFLNLPISDSSNNDFIHPEQFVLIDKYRNIRGYYNGLDSNDVRRCAEDIAYLMVEKNRLHEKRKR
ncbi:MAG: SCO family protein [Chitinophagaceae bacterium]|nr:SCO family protein [Chitinophagaceae bacterium]